MGRYCSWTGPDRKGSASFVWEVSQRPCFLWYPHRSQTPWTCSWQHRCPFEHGTSRPGPNETWILKESCSLIGWASNKNFKAGKSNFQQRDSLVWHLPHRLTHKRLCDGRPCLRPLGWRKSDGILFLTVIDKDRLHGQVHEQAGCVQRILCRDIYKPQTTIEWQKNVSIPFLVSSNWSTEVVLNQSQMSKSSARAAGFDAPWLSCIGSGRRYGLGCWGPGE